MLYDKTCTQVICKRSGYIRFKGLRLTQSMATFELIYLNKVWGTAGDGSGEGSDPIFAEGLINSLISIIQHLKVTNMLDAPCGAAAWVPRLLQNLPADFKYSGVDISETAVRRAQDNLKNSTQSTSLCVCDLTTCVVEGEYDMLLCRDALQHMSYKDIAAAIGNLQRINTKWYIMGSYLHGENKNIETGHNNFLINLMDPPFNMKPDMIIAELHPSTYYHKHLYVYSKDTFNQHKLVYTTYDL